MKLIVTIVDAADVDRVMAALTDQHIRFTHVSSTVSFLNPGNSTLLIGVDEKDVPQAMKIIADLASLRTNYIPATYNATVIPSSFAEVEAGGFQSFVLNVVHFEQV
ncbi:MAG: cyclic-di-AMP receptor [Chloroflexota bacterium]